MPGAEAAPDADGRTRTRGALFQVADRHRLASDLHLWAGVRYQDGRFELIDPDRTTFGFSAPDAQGNILTF